MIEKLANKFIGIYLGTALAMAGASPDVSKPHNPIVYDTPAETKIYPKLKCDANEETLTYQYFIHDLRSEEGKLVRTYHDKPRNTRCTIEYYIDKAIPQGSKSVISFKRGVVTYGDINR